MAFKKGKPKTGGRKKGVTNVVQKDIKEAFKRLLENNLDNMTIWIEKIGKKNPSYAFTLMLQLAEYNIPKLSRAEMTGTDGADLTMNIVRTVISKKV
jgi:hypothetical protein